MIELVERFHCKLCDYITESKTAIDFIKENGQICPACGNGEGKSWSTGRVAEWNKDETE